MTADDLRERLADALYPDVTGAAWFRVSDRLEAVVRTYAADQIAAVIDDARERGLVYLYEMQEADR